MTAIRRLPLLEAEMVTGNNEDWLDAFVFVDDAAAPIALAGISFTGALRVLPGSEATFLWLGTAANGREPFGPLAIEGDDGNRLAVQAPAAVMKRVPPGLYVFDILASAEGVTRRAVAGRVEVVQGVTR